MYTHLDMLAPSQRALLYVVSSSNDITKVDNGTHLYLYLCGYGRALTFHTHALWVRGQGGPMYAWSSTWFSTEIGSTSDGGWLPGKHSLRAP